MMRASAVEPQIRVQLDADPEFAESFLGPEPDLTDSAAAMWAFYWTVRNATPSDMPIDLERAIALNDRLHGEAPSTRLLVEKLQAMDVSFLTARGEHMKSKKTKAKGS